MQISQKIYPFFDSHLFSGDRALGWKILLFSDQNGDKQDFGKRSKGRPKKIRPEHIEDCDPAVDKAISQKEKDSSSVIKKMLFL